MAYPFLALFLAVITTPLCIKLAKRFGLYDLPDSQRKTHEWKIPYTGGLSIVFSVSATVVVMWLVEGVGFFTKSFASFIPLYLYTAEATIIIVVLGLYDDLKELTYFQKFFFQFIAAFLMILGAIKSDLFPQVFSIVNTGVLMNSFGMVISVLWIVGTTNAINMIDGMDGLAAGTSIISAISLAVVAFIWGHAIIGIILLTLAGSLTGFLVYNAYPAKIFMGDGGSMFVGFILAACGWVLVGSSPLTSCFGYAACILQKDSERKKSFQRRPVSYPPPAEGPVPIFAQAECLYAVCHIAGVCLCRAAGYGCAADCRVGAYFSAGAEQHFFPSQAGVHKTHTRKGDVQGH
jgi:UDP-N-acetylmuramyl pentapeptide phosphotransferase/UDP-N-acetylglucosamine-1-phosphate transferase